VALESTTGTFTAPTSNGTQAISGLGFQPKLVIVMGVETADVNTSDYRMHYGAATSSVAGDQWAVSGFSNDNQATSDASRFLNTGVVVGLASTGQSMQCVAELDSIDSDGFTLNWTTTSAAVDFIYIALGGSSLDVEVGTVTYPNTTGDFSETGVGFQPKAVVLCTSYGGMSSSSAQDSRFNIGMAVSSSSRFSLYGGTDDNQATSDAFKVDSVSFILERSLTGAGSIDVQTDFVSMDADGFTLNNTDAPGGTNQLPYIAYGGTINTFIGQLTQPGDGNQVITGVGFEPSFTFLNSIQSSGSFDTVLNNNTINLGFGDSVNNANVRAFDFDGQSTTNNFHSGSNTKAFLAASSGSSSGDAVYTSNDPDGFTLNWSNTSGSTRRLHYLSIGDAASGGISGTITQTTSSFTQSLVGTIVNPIFTGDITQTAQSFTQSAIGETLFNVSGTITQSASSFTQSLIGLVTVPVTGVINQTISSFTQSAIGNVPIQWADKLPVSTTWINQAETVTTWTNQDGVSTTWTDKV